MPELPPDFTDSRIPLNLVRRETIHVVIDTLRAAVTRKGTASLENSATGEGCLMALSPTVATTLRLHNPSIAELADWIPFFDLSIRKVFLTCCQTGLSAKSSHRIERDLQVAFMKCGQVSSLDERLERLELMTVSLECP